MKQLLLFFFLLPLFAMLSFSCTKKQNGNTEPELPPLTTEGKNVMGCKVNGEVQIYSGKGTLSNDVGVYYFNYSDRIEVFGNGASGDERSDINLIIYKPVITDTPYNFSSEISNNYAKYFWSTNSKSQSYFTQNGTGWVKFSRLDEHIAAGAFEFTAYHDEDSVVITEGRFDISE